MLTAWLLHVSALINQELQHVCASSSAKFKDKEQHFSSGMCTPSGAIWGCCIVGWQPRAVSSWDAVWFKWRLQISLLVSLKGRGRSSRPYYHISKAAMWDIQGPTTPKGWSERRGFCAMKTLRMTRYHCRFVCGMKWNLRKLALGRKTFKVCGKWVWWKKCW